MTAAKKFILRYGTLFAGAIVTIGFLIACAPETRVPSPMQLIIISPHYEGIRKEYATAFNALRQSQGKPEVEFVWIDQGGTSDDLRFVKSEFARTPEGINIDLFWGGGIDPYQELKKMHLLERYEVSAGTRKALGKDVNGVPVYDATGYWYGSALSGFGIMYNKAVLKARNLPEPKSWEDLTRSEFSNWVAATDPRHSGSAHMMFEIVLQAYGWEKGFDLLGRIAANSRTFTQEASRGAKDVAQGDAAAAPMIDFYAWAEAQNVGDKIGFVYPEGVTVINPDGIAILKGAPHMALAREFVEFVLSEAGQKLLMLPRGAPGGPKEFTLQRMAVLPDLYGSLGTESVVDVNPFQWKAKFVYDSQKGSSRWDIVNDLIGALMIDNHDALIAAAGKLRTSKEPLVVPPITDSEALQLAAGKWKDAVFRNKTLSQWTSQAKKRYQLAGA